MLRNFGLFYFHKNSEKPLDSFKQDATNLYFEKIILTQE